MGTERTDEEGGAESDQADLERSQSDADESDTEDSDDESDDDGQGLTDEARSRGGKQSSREQERDEQGRFVGKD